MVIWFFAETPLTNPEKVIGLVVYPIPVLGEAILIIGNGHLKEIEITLLSAPQEFIALNSIVLAPCFKFKVVDTIFVVALKFLFTKTPFTFKVI